MIANYHSHTTRCNHATGTEEEYIQAAIHRGLKIFGFSDHTPQFFPGDYYTFMRMYPHQLPDYCETVRGLQAKYADQIRIPLGLEAEYYPISWPELLPRLQDAGIEYLILGQHYPENELSSQPHSTNASDSEQRLCSYVSCVLEGMKSGYFSYVAHPDVLHFTGDPKLYNREMRKICVAARELNIPLEINFLGLREGRHYPNPVFWKIAGEEQAPVTFGCDAHDVFSAFDANSLKLAQEMVKEYGLNYIGMPSIRLIHQL